LPHENPLRDPPYVYRELRMLGTRGREAIFAKHMIKRP
jgi:hypothetical protein